MEYWIPFWGSTSAELGTQRSVGKVDVELETRWMYWLFIVNPAFNEELLSIKKRALTRG